MYVNDNNPQTFSLALMMFSSDAIDPISTENYEVGKSGGFTVTYNHIVDGNFAESEDYSSIMHCLGGIEPSGTVIITASTSDEVKGTINAMLLQIDQKSNGDCETIGTINIIGEFTASRRAY